MSSQIAISPSRRWIIDPWIDLLFCCGGLVWIFFAFHYFVLGPKGNGPAVQALALLALAGTHALSETHTAATLVRAYGKDETRRRHSLYTHWAALACGALAIAGMTVPGVAPILAKIYLMWVIQHFTAQTYGLTLLYCYKNGYKLGDLDKRIVWLLLNITAVYALVRMFTLKEFSANGFLAQHIPFWGPLPPWIFAGCTLALEAAAVLFASMVIHKAIAKRSVIPLPALLMVATGVMIFVFGRDMSGILWLYVPAFFHGSQYVVLSASCYLKENACGSDGQPVSVRKLLFELPGVRYQLMLFIIGLFIYLGLPRLLQDFGFDYTLAFASIFSCVNIHHFLVDSVLWKMRDPATRQVLLS
jgi:hypothetical protein